MADAAKTDTPPVADSQFVYPIGYTITAHGEDIKSLSFREPTGADIVRYGNPLALDGTINESKMEGMMSALAGVPPSTIKQLKARDWNAINIALAVRYFFPPSQAQTG